MLKFFDGQTDRQTDRVITIGHLPSGGALKSELYCVLQWKYIDKSTKYPPTWPSTMIKCYASYEEF